VVWFGERLPPEALHAAMRAAAACDVFLSVGTSGLVEPAASLPYTALERGARVIEVNPQPTPLAAPGPPSRARRARCCLASCR
jgi:NAD-dependent deacetylase